MTGWAGGRGGLCQGPGTTTATSITLLLTSILALSPRGLHADTSTTNWHLSNVSGVAGTQTQLPCIVANTQKGSPTLVLWYKDGTRIPFYTLDLREGGNKGEYVANEYKGRVTSDMTGSKLLIKHLKGSDAGDYKCRVDFDNDPTLSALVNLTVF
ncbi:hypothetical protein SK128_004781, partial [Halocaridina rubra]